MDKEMARLMDGMLQYLVDKPQWTICNYNFPTKLKKEFNCSNAEISHAINHLLTESPPIVERHKFQIEHRHFWMLVGIQSHLLRLN